MSTSRPNVTAITASTYGAEDRLRPIPIHRADPVQQYLHRHRTTVVEPFPRYAPDLNPVDKIWFYVKFDRLPNYAPPDLTDLRLHIKREFRRLQKRSALLESLFKLTKLTRDW